MRFRVSTGDDKFHQHPETAGACGQLKFLLRSGEPDLAQIDLTRAGMMELF
jgi:hypothetical protein